MEESELQQTKVNIYPPEVIVTSEAPLVKISPPSQTTRQVERVGAQVSDFLAQLPDYIGKFFNDYKQPITSVALIFASIITVKVVLAVLTALNDVPLLSPTFELVGIGYSVWFVNRYLLKASTRQELGEEIDALKGQVIGSQQLPESGS